MNTTQKQASQIRSGDRVVINGKSSDAMQVRGTSRAMAASADRIAIIGTRAGTGQRSPVWYFDLEELVTVM